MGGRRDYRNRPLNITHCRVCHKELTRQQRSNRQMYCSKACAGVPPIESKDTCQQCGVEYKRKSRDRKGMFCSRECSYANRKESSLKKKYSKITVKTCVVCGKKEIKRPAKNAAPYCSEKCRYAGNGEEERRKARERWLEIRAFKLKPPEVRRCTECGEEFISEHGNRRRVFCGEECQKKKDKKKFKVYLKANPEHRRRWRQNRRAREKNAFVEAIDLKVLYLRDGGKCQICGTKLNLKRSVPHKQAPTIDHILPLSKGGKHEYRNTQVTCFSCNIKKGNRTERYAQQLRVF